MTTFGATPLTAQAALLALPSLSGVYTGRVLHRGNARRIALRVPSQYHMPIRVRVRTYSVSGRRLRTFFETIHTKHWALFASRGAISAVWTARARCCPA